MSIIYALVIIMRYYKIPNFNESVEICWIFSEATLFWVTLCSMIHGIMDTGQVDNEGLLFMIVGWPITVYAIYSLINYRKWRFNNLKYDLKNPKGDSYIYYK